MHFVIVGAGGVGGNLGARLVEAGHRVAWLARGSNLEALRKGLALKSTLGDLSLGPQEASDDAASLAKPDAVIVTVKLYDLAALAPSLAPLREAVLLPLQNGVEARSILQAALPGANVLGGMVSTKAYLEAPGRIVCKSGFSRIRLGGPQARELATALETGKGVGAAVSGDIETDVWRKFVMLAAMSAISCVHRATIGTVLREHRAEVLAAVDEALQVSRALGVELEGTAWEIVEPQVRDMPPDGKPSMLEDLEAGRRLEIGFTSGTLVRLGRRHGVPTPVHAKLLEEVSRLEAH
jgi:2-dehydropantoate 2-reductase